MSLPCTPVTNATAYSPFLFGLGARVKGVCVRLCAFVCVCVRLCAFVCVCVRVSLNVSWVDLYIQQHNKWRSDAKHWNENKTIAAHPMQHTHTRKRKRTRTCLCCVSVLTVLDLHRASLVLCPIEDPIPEKASRHMGNVLPSTCTPAYTRLDGCMFACQHVSTSARSTSARQHAST